MRGAYLGGRPRSRFSLPWVAAAAAVVVGLTAGTATGAGAQNGPTPPAEGDPIGSDISPHGGYSTSTNFCLECHGVHAVDNPYALLFKENVTAVCGTCHMIFALGCSECHSMHGPGGLYPERHTPVGPGTVATTSSRSVYSTSAYQGTSGSAHGLGGSSPPLDPGIVITSSDWSFHDWPSTDATTPAGPGTSSTEAGGLYCGSCHTPHGAFGQVVNEWTDADEGTEIWWSDPAGGASGPRQLHRDPTTGAWQVCQPGNVDCEWAQVLDSQGQLVSLFAYKLLSASPNHSWSQVRTYLTQEYNLDGGEWCGACHPSPSGDGGNHRHDTGCGACHGNPANGDSMDFPHTSAMPSFLREYPDGLCLSCHISMP